MNTVTLGGKLTKKPELKQTKNGKSIAEFSIAINRGIKDNDGKYIVDFVNCKVWNRTAENLCNFQDKGDYVIVQGKLQNDNYVDKDGNNRYTTYVLADNVEFMPKKKENRIESPQNIQIPEEDMPFFG